MRSKLQRQDQKTRQLEEITEIVTSRGSRIVSLDSLKDNSSTGSIYWDVARHKWIVCANLPQVPTDKTYQLWIVTGKARTSAGLMKIDETGHGHLAVDLSDRTDRLQVAALTVEPEGGSPQPTGDILAVAKLD
jgi:anti-sigma-K factor RskA